MNKNYKIKIAILITALVLVCVIALMTAKYEPPANVPTGQRSFLAQFVISGGPIVWFIMLPLSVFTIQQGLSYLMTITTKQLLPENFGSTIIAKIRQHGCEEIPAELKNNTDMVSTAIARATAHISSDRRQIQLQLQLQNVVTEALAEHTLKLIRKIEPTNIIGNVAPMIGLFGTVFGMIKLFNSIVIAGGQPRPEQMADGISVALVTTFWGLLIAIPSLAIHSIFKNKIESIASEAAIESEMIIIEIKKSIETSVTDEN